MAPLPEQAGVGIRTKESVICIHLSGICLTGVWRRFRNFAVESIFNRETRQCLIQGSLFHGVPSVAAWRLL